MDLTQPMWLEWEKIGSKPLRWYPAGGMGADLWHIPPVRYTCLSMTPILAVMPSIVISPYHWQSYGKTCDASTHKLGIGLASLMLALHNFTVMTGSRASMIHGIWEVYDYGWVLMENWFRGKLGLTGGISCTTCRGIHNNKPCRMELNHSGGFYTSSRSFMNQKSEWWIPYYYTAFPQKVCDH